jgi:hypothetical protein
MCKATGQRCRLRVIGGGPCRVHGGAAPQVRARREVRLLEWQARQGEEPHEDRDPGEQLLAAAREADRMAQRLRRALDGHERLDPAAVMALGDWLDRVGRLSRSVLDARIDERQVRLAERQGDLVAAALEAILVDLELNSEQQARVPEVVPRHLLAITTGSADG